MGRFDGCLLACDIDGTLLFNGIMPQRNIEAIERFKSEGGKVCIATGRTTAALSPITAVYNGYCPSVVSNGSEIYDTVNKKTLYNVSLEESEIESIDRALKVCKNVGIEVHSGLNVYTVNETGETVDHQTYEKMTSLPMKPEEVKNIKPNKILYLFDNEKDQETVKKAVIPYAKKSSFCDTLVTLYGKPRRYLEHMPANVSKANTLLKLADMLGIKREKFFAIGDGYNDIEMLSVSALSACPSSAPKEVKAAADVIVCDAQNGAVADFIDYLFDRF